MIQCLTMDTITIRLPDELRTDLQRLSQEWNKPISDLVRESIRKYFKRTRYCAKQ